MMKLKMMTWKPVITKRTPLSMSMPLAYAFTVNSYLTFANFCTQIVVPATTPPHTGVVTDFLINKCCLTPEEIAKAFRHCSGLLRAKSSQNVEEVLELLNGCGLTTPAQIRRVVVSSPNFFGCSKRNIQSKLTLLGIFMEEEAICKLLMTNARPFCLREDRLKSGVSLLQRLGVEGQELSQLLVRVSQLLYASEEKVLESFKQVENLGIKKGSTNFAVAIKAFLWAGKENIDRRLQCLSSLGFSENQISEISRRFPVVVGCSEENLKCHVEFLVKSAGFTLADICSNPSLFGYSLEKRIIPRYKVMEALKSMQVLKTEVIGPTIFQITEKYFLEKYVNNNVESLVLRDIYHCLKDGKLSTDKET